MLFLIGAFGDTGFGLLVENVGVQPVWINPAEPENLRQAPSALPAPPVNVPQMQPPSPVNLNSQGYAPMQVDAQYIGQGIAPGGPPMPQPPMPIAPVPLPPMPSPGRHRGGFVPA